MTFIGVSLALLSSFFWTCFNATRKSFSERVSPYPALVLLMAGQLPLFLIWAAVDQRYNIAPGYWLPGILSGLLNCFGNLFFLLSVSISPLSTTVPLLSFSPLFAGIFGVTIFGEHMEPVQWLAVTLVIFGCIFLNSKKTERLSFFKERGALFMVLTAFMWSSSSLADKAAVRYAAPPVHAMLQCAQVALFGLCGSLLKGNLHELKIPFSSRSTFKVFVLSLICAVGGLGFQLIAVQHMYVSLFETLKRSLEVFVTLAIGRMYFAEPITKQKIFSAILIVCGVALLLKT